MTSSTLSKTKQQETWLCLRFTHLALNSFGLSVGSELCIAVSYQQQIWQCNQAATELSIAPGMSVSHALMLAPDIQLIERDLQLENKKLQEFSYWGYLYTSLVSIKNDHTLLFEIGKSIKLFNNLEHIINLIKNDLERFNVSVALGVGNTPKAAYALSFRQYCQLATANSVHYKTELYKTKLDHLELEKKSIRKLLNCGFSTLNDIKDIPRKELGARFDKGCLLYLEQLFGQTADPQIGTTPPETFHASADFSEPISNFNWIQQQLERLLNDLVHFTTTRQLLCQCFTWRFYHENNRLLETVHIGVNAKQNSHAIFKQLTDLKLANIKLNWEFSSIELSCSNLLPINLFNDDLFNPRPNHEQFKQLIDKLSSRLGHTALFRVSAQQEHLPELANGQQHAISDISEHHYSQDHSIKFPQKPFKDEPLWVLETPKYIGQKNQDLVYQGSLTIIHGPNRISSHWWTKLQSRDYFIARQRNGRLVWIFLDRVSKSWYLHGVFA